MKAVVAAGAVATAVVAVVGLAALVIPDDGPSARVTFGKAFAEPDVLRLSQFVPQDPAEFGTPAGAAPLVSRDSPVLQLAAGAPTGLPTGSPAGPPPSQVAPSSAGPASVSSPPEAPSSPPQSEDGSSLPPSGVSSSVPSAPLSESSDVPSVSEETSASVEEPGAAGGYLDRVLTLVGRAGYVLDPDVMAGMLRGAGAPSIPATAMVKSAQPGLDWVTTDPAGLPIAPDEAASQIIQVLDQVRVVPVDPSTIPEGQPVSVSDRVEPVGVVVRLPVRIQHAKGVPVGIYWEMYGAGAQGRQLSREWMGGLPAIVVTATQDDDTGVVRLWIPMPREEGDYSLTLLAAGRAGEAPMAYATVKHLR